MELKQPVVIIDGTCDFCNRTVRFILDHEKNSELLFISSQSHPYKSLQQQFALPNNPDSVILIDQGVIYSDSTAAIRICSWLSPPLSLLGVFRVVPRWIRDWVYTKVAANRQSIVTQSDACALQVNFPRDRFIT